MAKWYLLGGIGLAGVLAVVLMLQVNGAQEDDLIPGPPALFLLQPNDAGPGFVRDEQSVRRWSRDDLHLSSFYTERDLVPTEALGAVTGGSDALRGAKKDRGRLEGWGWDGTAFAVLRNETAHATVVQSASLFRSSRGAKEAYLAAESPLAASSLLPETPGLGDQSVLYRQQPAGGLESWDFLFRQRNLFVRISVTGATHDEALALAQVVHERADGLRPLPLPASVTPTPSAQERWQGKDGKRPPAAVLSESPGPRHCGWEDMLFLTWQDRSFVRDTGGELAEVTAGRFEAAASLPPGAMDTGYRSGGRELWTAASDPDAVYVRSMGTAERWPLLEAGCA